jgi:hypothetical protein
MVGILIVLAILSLYFVTDGNTGLGNWFILLAILISTMHDRISHKRRYNSRTSTSRKKKTNSEM